MESSKKMIENIPTNTLWNKDYILKCLESLSLEPNKPREFVIYVTSEEDKQRKLAFGWREQDLKILPKLK